MWRDARDLGALAFRFAVISDTHVNPDEDTCNAPFPVNSRANRRLRHVIADLNRRDIDFVVHLGDLLHPVPETGPLYVAAAAAYRALVADLAVPIWHVPGNHDIGDTPVKGAPASPSTEAMIAAWTREFGDQYHAFSHGDVRFILLNAQLLNSGLPDEARQAAWFEGELASVTGRVMVMLHHPPYLCCPDEAPHYDNTDPPGRSWLLNLIEKHAVEALFAGHAHNFWYDRGGGADYYLAPSVCFVRQDYSEMLRVPPDASSEHGRNDAAKLGYFIVNVFERGHSVQFVRTFGAELPLGGSAAPMRKLAPAPVQNATARIGFDLRQNWAEIAEIPPSGGLDEFDRKVVRNDYPLLALIEMGIRDIRIPLADLRDPMRCKRLRALCHLGFRPTLFSFGVPSDDDRALITAQRAVLRDWEITADWPLGAEMQDALGRLHAETGLPIYLSRMRSKADLPTGSMYFHVINHGFAPEDLGQIDDLCACGLTGVAGVIFRLSNTMPVRDTLRQIDDAVADRALRASVHMRIAGDNPAEPHTDHAHTCARVEEAMHALPELNHTRIFLDTLADNDRGYFPRQGAIDRACNPNPLFEVIRSAHARA